MKIVACFLEYDGKFVILLRQKHKPNGGTWGLPAGKVEAGEQDAAALIRELYEETGYKATESQLEKLGNYNFGSGLTSYSVVVYRVQLNDWPEIILEKSAHSDYRWVTATECDALPNLIPDFHEALRRVGFVQ